MPVNGIEIKEDQIWEDGMCVRRVIKKNNKGGYPWIGELLDGSGEYSTYSNDGKYGTWDGYRDLVKLIEDVKTPEKEQPIKFNPQRGDKIICNNGEEFICCTKSFLTAANLATDLSENIEIFSYRDSSDSRYRNYDWMCWDKDGREGVEEEWNILEVIPQRSEVPADKKEEVKEEPRYTLQEIKEAWDASGWVTSTATWNVFRKNLMKNDEGFQEYLRLKAIYE